MKNACYVLGGLGDILEALPGLSYLKMTYGDDLLCYLISHYQHADKFLKHLNVRTVFYSFSSNDERIKYTRLLSNINEVSLGDATNYSPEGELIEPVENLIYSNRIKEQLQDATWKSTIGFHFCGSPFSNQFITSVYKRDGKNMPPDMAYDLLSEIQAQHNDCLLLIFLSPTEIKNYENLNTIKNCRIISFDNIWTSLCIANECDLFVASDSVFKSYRCLKNKETILFLNDYEDTYRDIKFINPYLDLLDIVKYNSINHDTLNQIIEKLNISLGKRD